ncbi:PAS domain S-box protein [Desulfobacula toluolica]|uniref:histidine kinase n=1 Tax=Desulfobacula toluolica (strain DSM 7467 / Tol2) TaxID=651182 RepID=K0NED9_DESTT|nr:PAS domain S-box protein [Desulfobacula toluolica]CCK79255.1 two component system sensor histidine kinase, hybrid [Desulfobacula toluolica Tol2]
MTEKLDYEVLEKRIQELEKENSTLRLFKFAIDNLSDSRCAIVNRDCRFETVSKGYYEAFNKNADQIAGKHISEILGNQMFKTIVKPNFDKALAGEIVNFSGWFDLPGGKKKFMDIQYFPVYSGDQINSVAILVHDLTRIKKAEGLLRESEANLIKAQQIAHIGNWNWDMTEDRISCSKEFYRILGIVPECFCPTYEGYMKYVHPEDLEMFQYSVKKALTETKSKTIKYRIVRPYGIIRTVHERAEVTVDSAGNPINVFGTIQDITEQVQVEEQYQTILKLAIDGFCLVDKQGQLFDVNDSYCKMLGYERDELLKLSISDIDVVQTLEQRVQQCKKIIKTGQDRFETKHRCKDGTLIDVEINTQYSDMKKGMFICFIRDITEKNKIREALKKGEIRYRNLFEGAPVMYAIIKNQKESTIITDCNKQFLTTLGYSRSEVIGKSISEFYTQESQKKLIKEESFRRSMENNFTASERELIGSDGRIINTLIQAVPEYDVQGNIIGGRSMYIDTTSQKRAEEQLRENHELLLMIVDGISDPLMMVDEKMNLMMMNAAAENYFKKNNETCLGRKCYQVFKMRQSLCEGCKLAKAISKGRQKSFERKGLMNPEKLERVCVYPVRKKGDNIRTAILRISDITRVKRIEKELIQADKMISLGVLVSGVAHEINNPNHLIMLNTPILWEAWEDIVPVVEKYYHQNGDFSLAGVLYSEMRDEIPLLFAAIKEGAVRIQRIVQDLKDFSRQDDTHMDQLVNINQVIENSIRLTENLIKKHTEHFKIEYSQNLPMVMGDQQKLEQVMINLIQNACQAVSDKKKAIFITSFFDEKKAMIEVEVRDEGVGIPQEMLDRIMDPFFTTKRSKGGTGLGLAVSSNIVKSFGGKIEVESDLGKGSVFKIFIPTRKFEYPVKILVADDDPFFREYLHKALGETERYSLREAVNGKEAFLKIGQELPDLFILDIQMPDMDGLDVCRLLKEKSELSDIKVIIITGFPESFIVDEIVKMGFDKILAKPFTIIELKKTIEKVMEVE